MTSTDDWPSPLPGPAWAAWRIAWDHITSKTLAGVSLEDFRHLMADPAVKAAEERCAALAQSGDVQATQKSAQVWNTAYRRALEKRRKEEQTP